MISLEVVGSRGTSRCKVPTVASNHPAIGKPNSCEMKWPKRYCGTYDVKVGKHTCHIINTWLMTTHVEWPNISEYDQWRPITTNQLWALRKRTGHFGFHPWIRLFAMQQPLPVLLHPSAILAVFRNEAALGLDRNGSWTITLGTSPSESYQWAEYQTPSPHIRQHEPGRSGAFPAVLELSRLYLYSWWNLQGSSKCQSGSSEYLVQESHFHVCCYMCSCQIVFHLNVT